MDTRAAPPAWVDRIPGPHDPLPKAVEEFLGYLRVQRNYPETTVRAYRSDLAKFSAFVLAEVPGDTARGQLRRYQMELADVIPHPRTRARSLAAVRVFLRWAYREDVYPADYSSHVTPPRFVTGDPHPLPSAMVPRLLAALPRGNLRELRDRALVAFLLATGCRVSECVAVNRADVRLEGFRILGKGAKYRTVYLTATAWEAVGEYLAARGQDEEQALWVNFWRPAAARARGLAPTRRLTADGVRAVWDALRLHIPEMAGLRSPHAARHTAATTLLEATGGDVRLVQEVLGHATLETLRVYTEITDKRKLAAYARLGSYLRDQATE